MLDGSASTASALVVVRTPPEVSLYHRHGNPLFRAVLERLGRDEPCTPSSSRAPTSSASDIRALGAAVAASSPTVPSTPRA